MTYALILFLALAGMAGTYFWARNRAHEELTELTSQRDVLKAQHEAALLQMEELKAQHAKQQLVVAEQHEKRVEELRRQHQEEMQQHMTLIKEQLKSSTEAVLKERATELSSVNSEQLSKVLTPLQQNIELMKTAVENSQKEHTERITRLDETIKTTIREANLIGERADRLAKALTGENKTQGNFGELRLRQLLENMGLVAGEQFTEQETLRDAAGSTLRNEESGQRMQPDVILHFPDHRDLVIDSKMSLTAFTDYHNAATDEERSEALGRHLQSVRQHVTELAAKNYSAYIQTGNMRVDYVIMYVPYESAYQLAMTADPDLYQWAYKQGVLISSTQSMYALLRMIEITWRQQRQVDNQENIMKAADLIIERVQKFYERMLTVRKQLDNTSDAFSELEKSLVPEKQSIINSANRLLKYGAKRPTVKKTNQEFPTDSTDLLTDEEAEPEN